LASRVVGLIEAAQQGVQIAVAGNRNAQHLALHTPVEALHQAVRARRIGPRLAMLHPELLARPLEAVGREARAAVGQHMGDREGEGLDGLFEEGDGAALGFVVLDRQMDKPGGAVDRHKR
jgi:hypothetical protein